MKRCVELDTSVLTKGRTLINHILHTNHNREMPDDAPKALLLFISSADTFWRRYNLDSSTFGFSHNALPAVTEATLALELAAAFREAVLKGSRGEPLSDAEKLFNKGFSKLVSLSATIVRNLKRPSHRPTAITRQIAARKNQEDLLRVAYAKHLTDMVVSVCRRPHGRDPLPPTRSWLKKRAAVKRSVARLLLESARIDNAEADASWCNL